MQGFTGFGIAHPLGTPHCSSLPGPSKTVAWQYSTCFQNKEESLVRREVWLYLHFHLLFHIARYSLFNLPVSISEMKSQARSLLLLALNTKGITRPEKPIPGKKPPSPMPVASTTI